MQGFLFASSSLHLCKDDAGFLIQQTDKQIYRHTVGGKLLGQLVEYGGKNIAVHGVNGSGWHNDLCCNGLIYFNVLLGEAPAAVQTGEALLKCLQLFGLFRFGIIGKGDLAVERVDLPGQVFSGGFIILGA